MSDTITKKEPKLSVRKPGVWRNRWLVLSARILGWHPGATTIPMQWIGGDEWLSGCEWPSAEIAEQKALEDIAAGIPEPEDKYLGPVFFPKEP